MFNPSKPSRLSMLGELVSIAYRDESGRRRVMRWGVRHAPIVAYAPSDPAASIVLIFGAERIGDSSVQGRAEYKRKHWGKAGDGDRLAGEVLAGKASRLGTALEITYATRKGADAAPVNYWHTFGDYGRLKPHRAFVAPAVARAMVNGRELVRIEGGSYTVTSHGIVG